MHLIPTILCGGVGSQLWPVSRELHPKPFIQLADGHSLFQKTFLRSATLPNVKEIVTVTNREHFFKVEDECREINQTGIVTSFILEPSEPNTTASIAASALEIIKTHGENTLLLVLAADHLISDQDAFQQAISDASKLALEGKLVLFGMQPDEANSGYGYIEAEDNRILSFIEKPALEKNQKNMATIDYLLNSGIYLFKAGTVLQAIEALCPDILVTIKACIEQSRSTKGKNFTCLEFEPESFRLVPNSSINDAVMEKSDWAAVVPCNIRWTDVGSWSVLSDLVEADANGNRIEGEALMHDVTNCFIQSESRLVAAVGVENLIIIDTPDALLVADKSRAQDIEEIYSQLKALGHETHKLHRTVQRPWGSYTILEESGRYKIKRIEVKPGASLSLQMHHHRSEHWVVVSGMAKVINGEQTLFVNTNESTYIPASHKHRLENPGVLNLVMIEVQSGEYLGEDDIVRFQDNYGRVR